MLCWQLATVGIFIKQSHRYITVIETQSKSIEDKSSKAYIRDSDDNQCS